MKLLLPQITHTNGYKSVNLKSLSLREVLLIVNNVCKEVSKRVIVVPLVQLCREVVSDDKFQ